VGVREHRRLLGENLCSNFLNEVIRKF
jgi:hypothetical protein